ncbi:unnamed protein product, partial [Prorocentrum cordatum]
MLRTPRTCPSSSVSCGAPTTWGSAGSGCARIWPLPARLWASLKTLAGVWTTSHRKYVLQNKRDCHYGCNAGDAMAHYLVCPRVLHHMAHPRGAVSTNPLDRFGMGNEDMMGDNGIQSSVARIAVACRVYHMVKDSTADRSVPYQMMVNKSAAACHALQLPHDHSGGAGAHITNYETNYGMRE